MDYILEIAKDLIELGVIILIPYVIKTLKALEQKATTELGVNNYNYAKSFIEDMYKAHADLFTEENLVNIIDLLDNKFGDRLSKETIKHLVDAVMSDVKKEIAK